MSGDGLEEIIALVVNEDKGGEILDPDLPDGLHSELGIFHALDGLDVVLGEDGGRATDGAEIESAVLLAGVGHHLGAVALRYHHHRAAMVLETVHVGIHTVCGGRAHGAAGIAGGSLRGARVIDGMVLEVLGQVLSPVEPLVELRVGDVAGHDDGSAEAQARAHGILAEQLAHFGHGLVEVYLHGVALSGVAQLLGNQLVGLVVELLYPHAVGVDLRLDVAVGRAADSEADGAARAVARQTYHAHVMGEILAAELGSETDFPCLLKQLLLQLHIAESASALVACGWQLVVVVGGGELHGEQVLLGGGSSDHEGNVVGRAGGRAEGLHFGHEEGHEGSWIEYGLGLLVKVGLVGRTASLGHAEKTVFVTLTGLDVNLRGQVALGVDLLVHVQRGVLRVSEILLGVGLVDSEVQRLLVAEACPYLLALLAVDDGGTSVLAERQLALACDFGVAQKGQRNVLVVGRSLGIVENLRHLLVVGAAPGTL